MINICHQGSNYQARALIDSGSEATFITERLFNLIKLPFQVIQAQLNTTAYVLPQIAGNLPSCPLPQHFLRDLPELPLADSKFYESAQIDLLIGADILPSILLSGTRANICGSLLGQETIFGWILTGPVPAPRQDRISSFSTHVAHTYEASLDKLLTKFWEVEDLPVKVAKESDVICEDNFLRTTTKDDTGRYVVSLPFRDPENMKCSLGHSRSLALAQFLRNKQQLKRDSTLKSKYDSVIQEYLDLNHMREVPPTHDSACYYLPHHAVLKPESTTIKLRVVFNASSPSDNGVSLNDILHAGPVLQSDLTIQILKWRYFRFVYSADIKKMYRQIWVDPNQTAFQRILFRNREEYIRDFELKTVTFGVNCAPFLAIRVLQQLATDVQLTHPRASKVIRGCMYVDDVLSGADSAEEAHLTIRELQSALDSAGFPLRKWTSNHKEVLAHIETNHLLNAEFLEIDTESTAKTLGVRWKATSDEFFFAPPDLSNEATLTKRHVLSQIAKLFDPAGWLAPFVICAKIFMQEIWLHDLGWDDELPIELCQKWHDFFQSYSVLDQVRIPRWVSFRPEFRVEHHGFCDASQKAYGAAIYVRVEIGHTTLVNLLTAKTRVAPVKTVSLPRLELCGALLLSEMAESIRPHMPVLSSKLHCWTDSTIVLAWLAKPACQWTTFVANRVTKITQSTEAANWAHVQSEHNPADLASRGVPLQDLIDNSLWWHGPTWLSKPRDQWPSQSTDLQVTEVERRPVKAHVASIPTEDILDRFSKLDRALRVLAYVHRFVQRCKKQSQMSEVRLEAQELVAAERLMVISTQRRYFSNEYRCLSQKRPVSATSSILSLNPFLDQKGLIRACGRITASENLRYDERHPIILPYECALSRLLVNFTHLITLHGGNQLVVRLTRSRYWIPRIKNLVKAVINSCKVCVIHKKRLQIQMMGSFPKERVSFSRPFTYTGMDYAGPFDIKNYTGRACLITKGPLSPMSEDPTDLLALTPGHFLVGGPLLSIVEPKLKGESKSIVNRWQHLKALHQQFQARWKEEYLKELHKRNKWQAPTANLRVGDLVVVKEDNLPSNEWRLGRIDSVFPGADGNVRVVNILTARKIIKRPVTKRSGFGEQTYSRFKFLPLPSLPWNPSASEVPEVPKAERREAASSSACQQWRQVQNVQREAPHAPPYARAPSAVGYQSAFAPAESANSPSAGPGKALGIRRFSAALAPAKSANSQSASPAPSLASILQRHSVNVLPTAMVILETGLKKFDTAALIDPCTPTSCIDASLATAFRLPTTTVGDERICTATIRSKRDDDFKLEVVLKVEPNVRIRTPIRELADTVVSKYSDLPLADERFYLPATISAAR
ncbi:uncharacterized protein [Drosophila takahashii]|uniref:uncharacterized protein n=1 Tax=Drosophila takahashii TaxID=29030 RepID=UPI00389938BC